MDIIDYLLMEKLGKQIRYRTMPKFVGSLKVCPLYKKEMQNNMKLCPLCSGGFNETDCVLHQRDGIHCTDGKSWKPMQGHEDYDTHVQFVKLLALGKV